MKKVFLTVIIVLVIGLTACTGKDNKSPAKSSGNSNTSGTSQGGNNTMLSNNGGNATGDLTTVNGFLSAFGLTENDLKCANFTRLDKTAYIIDEGPNYGKIEEVGAYASKKLTDEEAKAWLEQIIAKLNSLSDDGKVDNLFKLGSALTADYIIEKGAVGVTQGGGYYNYNGKKVSAQIVVSKNSLDNADPDEAMPACTLKLEWR